jgi:hypothetical protein
MWQIFVDDVRTAPKNFNYHFKSVNETISFLREHLNDEVYISLDHDSGDYAAEGGDYIHILDWLEEQQYELNEHLDFKIKVHSANPVGRMKMQDIISRNEWEWND